MLTVNDEIFITAKKTETNPNGFKSQHSVKHVKKPNVTHLLPRNKQKARVKTKQVSRIQLFISYVHKSKQQRKNAYTRHGTVTRSG